MNFFDKKTLFSICKQYAIYENKDQAAEKQNIGKSMEKHMKE